MRSTVDEGDVAAVWDIARPSRPSRVAGVRMAGFSGRSGGPIDEWVVPHPAFTVALQFGDGSLVVDNAAGWQRRGSLVAGLGPGAIRLRGNNIQCVEVRVSPVVAHAVLGVSPAELDCSVVVVDELWGPDAERIRQQLRDAPSWGDRFALTDALFARRHETGPAVDPEVAWAWDRIIVSRGRVRVEDLAVEVGWSRKRLWSRFRSQLGVPPKRAAKLVRFDHAALRLAAGDSAARAAAEGGYVDQSHFHRDVLAFTGMTPARLAGAAGLAEHDIAWAVTERLYKTDARGARDDGVMRSH
ncbi:helix-turn-helix domain-containing protein [Nocardia amamiensis]|uniref:helix-turn-helix domain-containing protein n=1 Tax=Nocardia amamiensis TaxID=404578 RepID=UPI000A079A8B|nr:AraC family transcriptional regulator [Nocardia amamiensis]